MKIFFIGLSHLVALYFINAIRKWVKENPVCKISKEKVDNVVDWFRQEKTLTLFKNSEDGKIFLW